MQLTILMIPRLLSRPISLISFSIKSQISMRFPRLDQTTSKSISSTTLKMSDPQKSSTRTSGKPSQHRSRKSQSQQTSNISAKEFQNQVNAMDIDQNEPQSLGSTRRFADTALSAGLKAVIPFETMSEIQAATIDAVLGGQDVLAQAKTGTGKTLAFLVPAVEKLRSLTPMPPNRQISILIISPTRELAAQIARECQPLLEGTSFGVQCVVGGTNINTEINKLKNNRCDVLVATPGRLKDHLTNQGLQGQLRQLRFFILDEADRLLDMGFKPDIDQILQTLPDRRSDPRQSMLFSATIPAEVMKVKNAVLLPNHAHISTLKAEDINAHLHVQQDFVIAHLHDHFAALLEIIKQDLIQHGPKSKIMVFFPTARATGLGGEVLNHCLKDRVPVFELHSRISQGARTKTAKKFSDCESGVLVTSDVSGRGVDYPNVTTVVQVGLPMTPEDYVHRLGRTARGGATGRGIIILAPFEQKFLTQGQMSSMPLKPHPPLDLDRSETDEALDQIPEQSKDQTYAAWLGYYKGKMKVCGFDPVGLVRTANEYVRDGMRYQSDLTPGLLAKTVGMMGLRGVPGLRIIKPDPSEYDRRGGGNDRRGGGNARGRGSKPAGRGRA